MINFNIVSNFQLFALRAFVLSLSWDRKRSGPCMTPENVVMILPITLPVCLMVERVAKKGTKCQHQASSLGELTSHVFELTYHVLG